MRTTTTKTSPRRGRLLGLMASTLLAPSVAGAAELATQSFRDEHEQVRTHLEHATGWVGQLPRQEPAQQKKTAEQVVGFFEQHIKPHAEWEEQQLYPLIDRLAGTGKTNRLTSTMRHEHRIVGRWIEALRTELGKPSPDYVAFSRQADQLIGLVTAHFEEEEEVLLPYADRKLTRAQFEKAVKLEGGAHH